MTELGGDDYEEYDEETINLVIEECITTFRLVILPVAGITLFFGAMSLWVIHRHLQYIESNLGTLIPSHLGALLKQFPPLAGSLWVAGKPDHATSVVLHGLQGPIRVGDREFNLVMPPQGQLLPDDQIAAILTYVRNSWGNSADKVTPEQVKAIRDANEGRTDMWTAAELNKLHPLPKEKSAIENLISYHYEGRWGRLPDFTKLEPAAVEEEHDGFILPSIAKEKVNFGLVWEGEFVAKRNGKYFFQLASDDGSRVVINDQEIVKVDGVGPITSGRTKRGAIDLVKGKHPIRVEFFQSGGGAGLHLDWKGPGIKSWQRLGQKNSSSIRAKTPIPIAPTENHAAIYRNFIAGTSPRAIGIGLPGGINFAYSADHLTPQLLWSGDFMDAHRHWTGRGQGAEPPAGQSIIKIMNGAAFTKEARFKGYRLDEAGNPTFTVKLGGGQVTDTYHAEDNKLVRTIRHDLDHPISIILSDQFPMRESTDGHFLIGQNLVLQVDGPKPTMLDGKVALPLNNGQATTLTYSWK